MKAIWKNKIKTIWAQAHRMGWDETLLHKWVESETGKKSIRSLTEGEAGREIKKLEKIPDPIFSDERSFWKGKGLMTGAQRALIGGLAKQMGWNRDRLEGLVKRMYGKKPPERLNKKQASGVIEALKAIKTRRAA